MRRIPIEVVLQLVAGLAALVLLRASLPVGWRRFAQLQRQRAALNPATDPGARHADRAKRTRLRRVLDGDAPPLADPMSAIFGPEGSDLPGAATALRGRDSDPATLRRLAELLLRATTLYDVPWRGGLRQAGDRFEALIDGCEDDKALAAALQLHLGQPEAAQALLDQIRPDHWRGAAVRALIYEAHSDADRACGAMAAAAALAPDHAKTHYTVEHGRMGLRVGRLREARTAFEAALELDATRSDAWRGLARARQRLGDRRGARRAFRKARANKG